MASPLTGGQARPGGRLRPALDGRFAQDVRQGLSKPQKELPAKYFYDAVGSALFEAITRLPEYGLTRAEERLLWRCAREVPELLESPLTVAELGSGSGHKTGRVLEAICGRQREVPYYAIDASPAALEGCRATLSALAGVRFCGLASFYEEGLAEVARRRLPGQRLLLMFLGSNLGNFDRVQAHAFLAGLRIRLLPGDALLLGTDLVKPEATLLAAYDDAAGVTAAFNLNLLHRINRELDADFDLRRFCHLARWCAGERRIEMHLLSQAAQKVTIARLGCAVAFEPGETIWTESSHKFTLEELPQMAAGAGFSPLARWVDEEWPFAESLWVVPEAR
ncbi:MAG TPA: L-histidine N(alpha)-methyltransferase [Terriglobales bacterium]|nr:L-histidine N(alpha)-methyltransferase [Terriglobales bacterium]